VVSSGGTTTGSVISGGGSETVSAGGATTGTVISNGGYEVVSSGGQAISSVISSGGTLIISSGGIASNVTVGSGSTLTLLSGGVLSGYTLAPGASLGAEVFISSGTAPNNFLSSLGSATVNYNFSGIVSGTTEVVVSGGSTTGTAITSSYAELVAGGTATATTVSNGGHLYVSSGSGSVGSSFNAVISSGGAEIVSGNGSVSSSAVGSGSLVLTGGTETLVAEGVEIGGTVSSGGVIAVSSGGLTVGETLAASGTMNVTTSGVVNATVVSSGAKENITGNGTTASSAVGSGSVILAGGTETLSADGVEVGGTVSSGGTVVAASGGVISGETIAASGTVTVSSGGVASNSLISGTQTILSAGSAVAGMIASGGVEAVLSGGIISGVSIAAGGTLGLSAGALTSGSFVDTGLVTVSGGTLAGTGTLTGAGTLSVAAGATDLLAGAGSTIALSGSIADAGTIAVGSGALFSDTGSISGGGVLSIATGAAATLASGSLGSVLDSGTLFVAGSLTTSINAGGNGANSVIDFTGTSGTDSNAAISNFGTGDDVILGTGLLAAPGNGTGILLSYNSVTDVLTATETNSTTGASISSTAVTLAGTSSFATSSFVARYAANGVNIELAASPTNPNFTFSTTGFGGFETDTDYTGGIAPGNDLSASDNITIARGDAIMSAGVPISDAGTISIANGAGLAVENSLSGAGSIAVGSGTALFVTSGGVTALTGTITDAGTIWVASGAIFGATGSISGPGTLSIAAGGVVNLGSGSLASILDAGTLNLAGALAGSINMQGNGANTVVDFSGTSDPATLTNFGTTDDIILGTGLIASPSAGTGVTLSYNTLNNVLTVYDTSSVTGSLVSASVTVTGTAAGALSTASFITLYGTNGLNIELAAGNTNTNFTFAATGSGSFETGSNFTGGIAPGTNISAPDHVTIASGTAALGGAAVTDAGTLTVTSGAALSDNGKLTGAGSLAVNAGGILAVTSGGTLALTGTLTDAGTIAVASGGLLSGSINGTGTLAIAAGAQVTLTGGSIGTIADLGTAVIAGSVAGSINLEGNGAQTVADFTGTAAATPVIDMGTTDAIILGSSILPVPSAGTGISLAYNAGVLTLNEGGTIATVTVSGTAGAFAGASSFITEYGAKGVYIELAAGPTNTNFTFSTTGSDLTPSDYTGGVAPGGTLVPVDTLTVAAPSNDSVTGSLVDNGFITVATGATLTDLGTITGTGTLAIGAPAGVVTIGNGGTLALAGTLIDNGTLAVGSGGLLSGSINGTGTLSIASGAQVTLTGGSIGTIADLGTVNVSGPLAGTINLEGTGQHTVADFSGASDSTPIIDMGATDAIILGSSILPVPSTGTGITLSYNTTAGVLTLTEGTTTTHVTVSGTAAGALNTGSFITEYGPQGVYIELASSPTNTNFTFTGTGAETNPANFAGGISPGDTIVAADTLTIAGAATVAGTLADLGITTIAAGGTLADAGSLTGTGTLAVGAGALLAVTSGGTLALAGTLTDNGTIAVASGGLLSGSINGTGTLAIAAGAQVTLTGGSIGTVADLGTAVIAGSVAGSINLEGNGAQTVADFTGTAAATPVIDMGTTDAIILGSGILPVPSAGTGISLAYNAGVLTLNEGGTIATVTVSGTAGAFAGASSFITEYGAKGVYIELAAGPTNTNFTFSTTGSDLTPSDYTGGVAPGGTLVPVDTLTVAAPSNDIVTGSLVDNGFITVATGATLTDLGTITGTGTLAIGSPAGVVTIGNGGTLALAGTLIDNGTLSVGSGGLLSGSINGTGTLSIASGAQVTLTGGSIGTIADLGTVNISGPLAGTINLEGNNAHTVADFTGTSDSTPITDLGTTDEIILGASVIPAPSTGSSISLSYDPTAGTLAVTDTSSSGSITTTYVTVSGTPGSTLSTASFVATEGPGGATIQLAQGFVFSGTGSFGNAADYTQSAAPPNPLAPVDEVTIASGAATIATPVDDEGLITIQNGATLAVTSTLSGGGSLAIGTGGTLLVGSGGTVSLTGPLSNAGTISVASGGVFTDAASLTGAGALTIAAGGTATIGGISNGSTGTIADAGTLFVAGTLPHALGVNDDPGAYVGTMGGTIDLTGATNAVVDFSGSSADEINYLASITGFTAGDTIILGPSLTSGINTGDSLYQVQENGTVGGTGTLFSIGDYNNAGSGTPDSIIRETITGPGGAPLALLPASPPPGGYTGDYLKVTSIAGEGFVFTEVPCFASGSRILGLEGEILVEDIKVGDELVTVRDGGPATRKVVWTGRRAIDITRHPRPDMVRPVRIVAGAFGDNVPERDLRLSPLHAVYVNGCLFEAISLVNGTTIYQEQSTRYVTYHHIELDAHDVLLAEGLPAESFLDTGDKNMFESVSGVVVLHPDFATPEDTNFCAPMVREGEKLEALRAELNARIRKQA
jgi:autotransporter passenger strand-loop-strand repeat protein